MSWAGSSPSRPSDTRAMTPRTSGRAQRRRPTSFATPHSRTSASSSSTVAIPPCSDSTRGRTGPPPGVVGGRGGRAGPPPVFLYAHHDVQPAPAPDGGAPPPFEPTEIDGR